MEIELTIKAYYGEIEKIAKQSNDNVLIPTGLENYFSKKMGINLKMAQYGTNTMDELNPRVTIVFKAIEYF